MRIRDLMSTNVVAVDENTSIHDAKRIMDAHKIRRLPVMRKDKLVGLVTKHMLLEASPSPASPTRSPLICRLRRRCSWDRRWAMVPFR